MSRGALHPALPPLLPLLPSLRHPWLRALGRRLTEWRDLHLLLLQEEALVSFSVEEVKVNNYHQSITAGTLPTGYLSATPDISSPFRQIHSTVLDMLTSRLTFELTVVVPHAEAAIVKPRENPQTTNGSIWIRTLVPLEAMCKLCKWHIISFDPMTRTQERFS